MSGICLKLRHYVPRKSGLGAAKLLNKMICFERDNGSVYFGSNCIVPYEKRHLVKEVMFCFRTPNSYSFVVADVLSAKYGYKDLSLTQNCPEELIGDYSMLLQITNIRRPDSNYLNSLVTITDFIESESLVCAVNKRNRVSKWYYKTPEEQPVFLEEAEGDGLII